MMQQARLPPSMVPMIMRPTRWVGNLKCMAVDDFSEVKDGLAIHRKVEMVIERGENKQL
jgi:hypothetical protein